jgi:orsellinic acid C2-O-methyltransferase
MPTDEMPPSSPLSPPAMAAWLTMAYRGSQAVIAATKLGVPDALGKGPRTGAEVAEATGTRPDTMHRLLRALAAFDVVRDLGDGRFELTPVGDCLRADAPGSVRPLALMYGSDSSWEACGQLAECIRTGQTAYRILHDVDNLFPYLDKEPAQARIFDAGQSASAALVGAVAAKAYDFSGIGRVVDVGGGRGTVLTSILKANPGLRGTLIDVPRVAEGAAAHFAAEGLADRAEAIGGDMFEAVPSGGDIYLLSHVIHDWGDEDSIRILQSCRHAMPAGAKLVILDRVMPERIEPGIEVQVKVVQDITMLIAHGTARERTARELETLLDSAGLRLLRIVATPAPVSLVEATLA